MGYSFRKEVDYSYEEAVEKAKTKLKEEGFGVLTEIDVKATIKKKLDQDFNKYIILGACNPNYAYQALNMEDELGLLLPCNVIVFENNEGQTVVSAIDPEKALNIAGNAKLTEVAGEVSQKLKQFIDKM